jgi:SOS-response transcriptional repressor LexA
MSIDQTTARAARTIKRLLGQRGWSQRRLSFESEVTPAQISNLLSGKTAVALPTLTRIAEALGVPLRALIEEPPLPVFTSATVPCGPTAELPQNEPDDWVSLGDLFGPTDGLFALRSRGESMLGAGVYPGDLLIFRRQKIADSGQKVLAKVGNRHTLKLYVKEGGQYWLKPAGRGEKMPFTFDCEIDGVLVGLVRTEL